MTKSVNGRLNYRASKNGFPSDFTKCFFQSNTITIIKTDLNYVFGCYVSYDWNFRGPIGDHTAFIFSLRRNGESKNEKFMAKKQLKSGLFIDDLSFKFGSDIAIIQYPNIIMGSKTDFGDCFELPQGYVYESDEAKSYLAGNYDQWTTTEIEIYDIELM